MKIKNVIAMGAAVVLVAGSALNVSAAEKLSSADLNALKESGKVSLIIDVDAYKTTYGNLKEAFINHYVTFGAAENRTMGTSNGYSDIATAEKSGSAISRSIIVSSKISNGGGSSAEVNQSYHHTTSIYEDNTKTTLLHVEYYDENNNLTHYSDVTYTDNSTNSYTENIYHWDEETGFL